MAKYYKLVTENRKAFHDFTIIDTYSAGISLTGSEVKSIRLGRVNLKDSFARVESGEVWLYNMHVNPYERSSEKTDPYRTRKLLLNSNELRKIIGMVSEKGFTLVPLKLYFSGDWAKVDIGVAKAKKIFKKKAKLIEKAVDIDIAQALKRNR
ncbi:SsrA-binding protein SmpB [Candidatus Saganbacteria bacterium]|nr:SsrA-binding protein SmpB [Candidatus Saganbacteria bacterium]